MSTHGRIFLEVPVKTESVLNGSHMHWRVVAGRRKRQRKAVAEAFLTCRLAEWRAIADRLHAKRLGIVVRLTRLSAGELDTDNLAAALKSVRDQVTACLGLEDDADPRLTWVYAQEKAKRGTHAVRIEVCPPATAACGRR